MNSEEKQKNNQLAEKLLSEQNFAAAIIAGAIATLIAAVGFGTVVAAWTFAYGFAAAGVGIVIGLPVGFLGRGIATKFAAVAAAYTIIGCVLGNLAWVVMDLAQASGTSPVDVLVKSSLPALARQAMSDVSGIYLLFWFVAIIAAVFLARRPLSRAQRLALGMYEMRR